MKNIKAVNNVTIKFDVFVRKYICHEWDQVIKLYDIIKYIYVKNIIYIKN